MDTPVTPKQSRPFFGRSQSATARLSPPQSRTLPIVQPTANRKHMHPLKTANERLHRHGHAHGDRHGLIQSAIDYNPGHAIAELGRFASRTTTNKQTSADTSRHVSPGPPAAAAPPEQVITEVPTKPVRPLDVERERQRQEKREEELLTTLNDLLDVAHDNTRRLDKLHSALLEKVAVVRSTIQELQSLSRSSSELHEDFRGSTTQLDTDIQRQVNTFAKFEFQHSRVDKLVDRVHMGQEKAEGLSHRLEAARGRVELWETEENEWQSRTSKRLKLTWTCCIALGTFVSILLVLRYFIRGPRLALPQDMMSGSSAANGSFTMAGILRSNHDALNKEPHSFGEVEDTCDSRLRIFDEL